MQICPSTTHLEYITPEVTGLILSKLCSRCLPADVVIVDTIVVVEMSVYV